jgi:hypothetical protein
MKAVRHDGYPLLIVSVLVMLLDDGAILSVVDSFGTYNRVQAPRRQLCRAELCMLGWAGSPFSFRFPSSTVPGKSSNEEILRDELKERLLKACRSKSESGVAPREVVESAIAQLVPYSPIKETCTSPLLQRKWKLYVLATL